MPTILLPSHVKHVSYTRRTRTFTWLIALMLLVGLTVPHTSTAQSIWSSPFDSGPEDEEDTYSTWGTPNDASTYSNPWGSDEEDDDSWGYNPWDTSYDDPWDSSSNSSGGSDWSSDFYDFDDENSSSSGSADRVEDGPTMMGGNTPNGNSCSSNSECQSGNCCIIGSNFRCETSCPGGGPNVVLGNDEEVRDGEIVCTNPGSNADCDNATRTIPVDGALLYLVIIGVAYGAYKLRGL